MIISIRIWTCSLVLRWRADTEYLAVHVSDSYHDLHLLGSDFQLELARNPIHLIQQRLKINRWRSDQNYVICIAQVIGLELLSEGSPKVTPIQWSVSANCRITHLNRNWRTWVTRDIPDVLLRNGISLVWLIRAMVRCFVHFVARVVLGNGVNIDFFQFDGPSLVSNILLHSTLSSCHHLVISLNQFCR